MNNEESRKEERRQVRRDANFVGFLLIAVLVGQLVVAFGIGILLGVALVALLLFGVTVPEQLMGDVEALIEAFVGPVGYQLYTMLTYVLSIGVPVLLVALIARRDIHPFPTRRVPRGTYPLAIFGGMAVSLVANVAADYVMGFFELFGVSTPEMPSSYDPSLLNLALNVIAVAVLPALLEEMMMRGFALGALRPHGEKAAVIITAVLFGLIHGNVLQLPFAFILGIILGWLTVKTGSIWPAVVLHFTNNGTSVLLSWLEQFSKQVSGITTVVFFVFSLVGTVIFLAVYLRHTRHGEDVLAPLGNGTSALTVNERVKTMMVAPAFLVGGILWILMLLAMTALL